MRLELVPCPTCTAFGKDDHCPECLGNNYIPVDLDLETEPAEPLGVLANCFSAAE